uniref:Uncharacterized protein n=1 Tax=Ralstonia syzygii R24 TaxID=907261 RepID=G3A300_9RALS
MSNAIKRHPCTVVIGDTIIQTEKLAKRLPFARKPADLSEVRGKEYVEVYVTETKELTTTEFDDFASGLLVSRDWLHGKGGQARQLPLHRGHRARPPHPVCQSGG